MMLFRSWKVSRIYHASLKELILLITVTAIAMGCSGGGGGGGGGAPVNSAPVVTAGCSNTNQYVDRYVAMPVLSTHMGTLMANDPDGDPISFSVDVNNPNVSGPVATAKGGMVSVNTVTGDFMYTPPAAGTTIGQSPRGLDSFDFRVDDPTSFSIGTETVIVNPTIMPLGDSITLGTGNIATIPLADAVSYRMQLLTRLNAAGIQFEYVGFRHINFPNMGDIDSPRSGDNILPAGQTRHSGLGSFRDSEIGFGASFAGGADDPGVPPPPARPAPLDQYAGIFQALEDVETDIILLHIGSNPTFNPSSAAGDTIAILNQIGNWEDMGMNRHPVATMAMQIINQCNDLMGVDPMVDDCSPDPEGDIAALNMNVTAAINALPAMAPRPDELIFGADADVHSAFGGAMPNPLLYIDDFHPNQVGYNIIGDVIFNALTAPTTAPAILQSCP